MDSQPAAKKRKIAPIGPSNSQPNQSSFADVLQRLKDDAGESRGPSPLLSLPFVFSQSLLQTRRVALTAGPVHLFPTLMFSATA